jgi:pimeloyl-ACP methyl ester carboxylesterase
MSACSARAHGIRLYPRVVSTITEHSAQLAQLPIFWRSAPTPSDGDRAPVLYLHGVPTNSDDWISPRERRIRRPWWQRFWRHKQPGDEWLEAPRYAQGFLERSGGLAPDLPGFGRSGKPGSLAYTIDEYRMFLEAFLELLELEKVSLVMHDWGSVGLAFAQAHPERVERMVLIDTIPFLPGYQWHQVARLWRRPLIGELAMGATSRWTLRRGSRDPGGVGRALPESWLDSVLEHFDQGTQRAILRLYRSSPEDVLAAAGERLVDLKMPALVVWGTRDPYIPLSFAHEYARVLPNAQLVEYENAGHWPWLDSPEVIDRVLEFLG